MPYTKELTNGKKESYEIKSILIFMETKNVQGSIDHIVYDQSNIPRVEKLNFSIQNEDHQIIDPQWSAGSNPPKPEGFDKENPDTWGGLSYDDIPKVIDPNQQFFNLLVKKSGSSGSNIYERIKNTLYGVLTDNGFFPTGSGWVIE